nr:uncharacterized protein LOC105333946 isoform X3 [Crassostrea gigas]
MEEGNDGIVQEFTLWKSGGQRVILKIDSEQGNVKYIRKGQVKHSCMIKDLIVTNKDGLQITVNIEHQQKILSAENSQMKEEILKNIKEVIEQHTPKPNIPLNEGSRTIKEGYLIKKGNAVIEKWARRKICVKQGFLIYYPDHSEKIVKLSPVIECHVEAVGTDKFNVIVPERTYSFQIPDSVRDKEEERDNWIKCIRTAITDRVPPQRPGFHQVLPDDVIRKSIKRKTIPKSLVVKQGYLDKRGNAKVKVWNERFVSVEIGKFSYALPNKTENTLNVVNLQEGEVSVISTKTYGFDVQIPGRTFHFRIQAKVENKEEEHLNWMKAFNKACCSTTSSELIKGENEENDDDNTQKKEKELKSVTDNTDDDESCSDTSRIPLKGSFKESKLGSTRSYRKHLRGDSLDEHL